MADNVVDATIVDLAVTMSMVDGENLQELATKIANLSRATRSACLKAKQDLDRSNAEITALKGTLAGLEARNVALADQARLQVDAIAYQGVINQSQAAAHAIMNRTTAIRQPNHLPAAPPVMPAPATNMLPAFARNAGKTQETQPLVPAQRRTAKRSARRKIKRRHEFNERMSSARAAPGLRL